MIVNFYLVEYGFNLDSVLIFKKLMLIWYRIVEVMKFVFVKRSGLGDFDMESKIFKDEIDEVKFVFLFFYLFFCCFLV